MLTNKYSSFESPAADINIFKEKNKDCYIDEVGAHAVHSLISASEESSLKKSFKLMSDFKIGCLPITKNGGEITGIVTLNCLMKAITDGVPLRSMIGDIKKNIVSISYKTKLNDAIRMMRQRHLRYLFVVDLNGKIEGLVSQTVLLDATLRTLNSKELLIKDLTNLAYRDPLTNLYSRRYFDSFFENEFQRCVEHGGLLSLLLIDMDKFKNVNDLGGHAFGDEVLKVFANIARKHLRKIDICARLGGDEFGILMPGTGTRAAKILGVNIRREFKSFFMNSEKNIFPTISGGICKFNMPFAAPENMYEVADACLYKAKSKGGNWIVLA